jgi:hypothetical protein
MTGQHSIGDLLHRATHHVPGVPAHAERPAGHQGTSHHGGAGHRTAAVHRSRNPRITHNLNHTSARLPRVLAAWQNRIAAFFGRELR